MKIYIKNSQTYSVLTILKVKEGILPDKGETIIFENKFYQKFSCTVKSRLFDYTSPKGVDYTNSNGDVVVNLFVENINPQ